MVKKKKDKPVPSKEKSNFLGAAGRNQTYRDLKRKAGTDRTQKAP